MTFGGSGRDIQDLARQFGYGVPGASVGQQYGPPSPGSQPGPNGTTITPLGYGYVLVRYPPDSQNPQGYEEVVRDYSPEGGGGGSSGRVQFESERAQDLAQADLYRAQAAGVSAQIENDRQVLQESIRAREQRIREIEMQENAATGRQREALAAERERLEVQLRFDREELRSTERRFDEERKAGYLSTAANIEDPARRTRFLLGDKYGSTPMEAALTAFKPIAVTATAAKGATMRKGATGGNGEEGMLVGENSPEVVVHKGGKMQAVVPITGSAQYGATMQPIGTRAGQIAQQQLTTQPTNPYAQLAAGRAQATVGEYPFPNSPYRFSGPTAWDSPDIPLYGEPLGIRSPEAGVNQVWTEWKRRLEEASQRLRANPNDRQAAFDYRQAQEMLTYSQLFNRYAGHGYTNDQLRNTATQVQAFGDFMPGQTPEERLRLHGEWGEQEAALRAFYGKTRPVGDLTTQPVPLAEDFASRAMGAETSGIDPWYGVAVENPVQQAARFYQLPKDVQDYILSVYGQRNLSSTEVKTRMKGVTPVGVRSGQFGYG